MKLSGAKVVPIVKGFEGGNSHGRNNKDTAMLRAIVLTVIFAFSLSFTSYAGIDSDLIKAASIGDISAVKALLEKGADVNAKNNDGTTALIQASEYGYSDIVKMLLAKGADVNAIDEFGRMALFVASMQGHYDIVKALLEKGADVNAKIGRFIVGGGRSTVTALDVAKEKGHEEIVQLLKKAGARIGGQSLNWNCE